MSTPQQIAQAYLDARETLSGIVNSPNSSDEAVAAAKKTRDQLDAARTAEISASYASRAAALNALTERLNGVTSGITVDAVAEIKARVGAAITNARNQILDLSIEVLHGGGAPAANPEVIVPDEAALIQEPPPTAAKTEAADDSPPAPPPRVELDVPPALIMSKPSDVPDPLRGDYEKLFATCTINANHVGQVNFHLQKLAAGRDRYTAVGGPLNIPWWFIGIIHGLESSFRFDRHLHNGDPLTARTVRVPKNRPSGNPPFTWETSAQDALRLKKLDQWHDGSVPGALFKWEQYNGFGYRKHHPDVLSPYLWSFTQHYTEGKYVADGTFDAGAISAQCGAAAMLRALVNKGDVSFA